MLSQPATVPGHQILGQVSTLVRWAGWVGVVLLWSVWARAETRMLSQEGPHRLARGEELKLHFPAVPAGQQVLLSWEARLDRRQEKGSLFYLEVTLNGEKVGAMRDRQNARLLNKPVDFKNKDRVLYWYATESGWRVVYAPDFDTAARRVGGHSADDFRFVVDVTDLCQSAGENTLVFRRLPGALADPLVLRRITVTSGASASSAAVASPPPSARAAEVLPRLSAADIQPLLDDDSLGIRMGPRVFRLATRYSLPGGGWAELKGVAQAAGRGGRLAHADFQVQRQAQWNNGWLEVEETVTNRRTGRPLGLRIEQRLALAGAPVSQIRLGGNPEPSLTQFQSGNNPTLFVGLGAAGLGIALEDNAMRAQHMLVVEQQGQQMGWQTQQFALAPGTSYTFRYRLYPLAEGNYFTFVNRLRQDWKAPRRLQGPFVLMFDPDSILSVKPEKLAAEIERLGIRGFGSGTWRYDRQARGAMPRVIGFGTSVQTPFFADYRQRLRQAGELIHKVAPDLPVFFYSNMHRHGPEGEGDVRRFAKEWMTQRSGKRVMARVDESEPMGFIVPQLDEAFGRAFREQVKQLTKELGYQGIYLDESNGAGTETWTYDRYDGVSGDLHPRTNEVVATKGAVSLLGLPYRLDFFQWMDKQRYFLLANGEPKTMPENSLDLFRMAETHQVPSRAYETHLYTPLAFTSQNPSVKDIRERLRMGSVPFRVGLGMPHNVLKYFFPLTITELGEGYVVGEERVITAISGTFRPAKAAAQGQLWLFKADGQPVEAPRQVGLSAGVQIDVPADGLAVLIAE